MVQERLSEYLKSKSLTYRDFERICNLSNGTAARLRESTRKSTFNRIANSCDLNIDWLLTGEGEMLRPAPALQPNATAIAPDDIAAAAPVAVRYFEVTPSATFQEFCSNASEAPSSIAIYPLPGETLDETYCIFEVSGESMAPQIQNHARVLCREIPPTRWHTLRSCVVVIAFADQFVIKRILSNHLDTTATLILASDNPDYPATHTVALSAIRCIFQATRIISSPIH